MTPPLLCHPTSLVAVRIWLKTPPTIKTMNIMTTMMMEWGEGVLLNLQHDREEGSQVIDFQYIQVDERKHCVNTSGKSYVMDETNCRTISDVSTYIISNEGQVYRK